MHHTLWRPGAVAALAFTLLACSDPGQSLDTIAPTVTAATAATTTAAPPTTTTATTKAPSTTADEGVDGSTTVLLPSTAVPTATTLALANGPWTVVDSIPEVTEPGLYYELSLPGLYAYFPTKVSPDDRVFWTMNEADRPIIEAYLNAQLTINQSMLTRPMDFNLAGWNLYFEDGGAGLKEVLEPRSADGLALNVDLGIVMRPWVIDDGRTETEANVIDCVNNGAILQRTDGSLSPTSSRGWITNDYAASMVLIDGSWKMRFLGTWEDACTLFGPSYAF